jgi:radical SAM-linked protein
VQRVRLRYAKRGRLRFTSHRDFARAFERALRRAGVPMAYSAGFTPHPKVSYVGAAPTGVASEAEYVEIGLAAEVDVAALREALDAALPDGLDIVEAVVAGPGALPERIEASHWRLELPGVDPGVLQAAVAALLAETEVGVARLTKDGRKILDARGPLVSATVVGITADAGADGAPDGVSAQERPTGEPRAILEVVVRQVTPTVRPDDVLSALRTVAGLALDAPPRVARLAQGPLDDAGRVGDPLIVDRAQARARAATAP